MNLLGPVLPQHSGLFGDWSIDATGGQSLEGLAWPGAGILALGALLLTRPNCLGWRRHLGLLIVLGMLALFALSNHVYAGHWLVLSLPPPPPPLVQFRATGRLIWPALYTLALAGVLAASRTLRPQAAAAVLLGAAALQLADTAPLWRGIHDSARSGASWSIDVAKLAPVFAAHDRLTVWPILGCGLQAESNPMMQTLLLASATLMPVNTAYSGRLTADVQCDAATVLAPPLQPGELRVMSHRVDAWLVPDARAHCRMSPPLALCATDAADWTGFAPFSAPALSYGVADAGAMASLTGQNWSPPDPDGPVWSDGAAPVLRFEAPAGGGVLTLGTVGFASEAGGRQVVWAEVNGSAAGRWSLPDMAPATLEIPVPAGAVTVQFHVAHPTRPLDRQMNGDTRALGLQLRRVSLEPGKAAEDGRGFQ